MLAGWLARSLTATHFFNVDVACANLAIFVRESCQNLVRRPEWPAGGDGSASADARGRRPAGRRSRPRTARRAVGARCRGCREGSFRGLDVPGWLAGSAPGGWLRSWPALAIMFPVAGLHGIAVGNLALDAQLWLAHSAARALPEHSGGRSARGAPQRVPRCLASKIRVMFIGGLPRARGAVRPPRTLRPLFGVPGERSARGGGAPTCACGAGGPSCGC